MTEAIEIAVTINGRAHRLNVAPRRVLADVLREDLQLLGCKIGCDQAVCGACTEIRSAMSNRFARTSPPATYYAA